jgi:cbb3-type cytochrome oxidase maturation protein
MEIMILLIGASMLLAMFFLIMFVLAGKQGQFRDTYTPSVRILFEDEESENSKISK